MEVTAFSWDPKCFVISEIFCTHDLNWTNSWWILHKYFAQAQRNLYKCSDCENLEVGSLAGESAIGFLVISQRSRVAQTEAPLAAITPPSQLPYKLNFTQILRVLRFKNIFIYVIHISYFFKPAIISPQITFSFPGRHYWVGKVMLVLAMDQNEPKNTSNPALFYFKLPFITSLSK